MTPVQAEMQRLFFVLFVYSPELEPKFINFGRASVRFCPLDDLRGFSIFLNFRYFLSTLHVPQKQVLNCSRLKDI
jgi:hypothetical protein